MYFDLPKRILFVAWLLAMGVAITRLVIGIHTSAIPPDPPPVAQASADATPLPAPPPAPSLAAASAPAQVASAADETTPHPCLIGRAPRRIARHGGAAVLPDEPPQSTADAPDPAASGTGPDTDPAQPEARPSSDFPQEGPISTQEARDALRLVGVDPKAEAAWARAINDPDRPADERKNLIEDLNEEGFPDPKRITAEDLPLIRSRLALIEEMAPDAIDRVNAAAFAEAYRDLLSLYNRFTRQ